MEYIKVVIIGIIEGITEWLPISSTGHMILAEQYIPLKMSEEFVKMFNVVIQLGAILAVVTLYFNKLNPLNFKKTKEERRDIWMLWAKVVAAVLPVVAVAMPLDDWVEDNFHTPEVIALTLILYGVVFVVMETVFADRSFKVNTLKELSFKTAFLIGCFQVLAIVPGTSRSGITIIGALLLGCSRFAATEFTFYLAIPVMAGASFLKIVKFLLKGGSFGSEELIVLGLGMVVAYVVSILTIRFLMGYIKKHNFEAFGYYRIVLGAAVLALMASGEGKWLP